MKHFLFLYFCFDVYVSSQGIDAVKSLKENVSSFVAAHASA